MVLTRHTSQITIITGNHRRASRQVASQASLLESHPAVSLLSSRQVVSLLVSRLSESLLESPRLESLLENRQVVSLPLSPPAVNHLPSHLVVNLLPGPQVTDQMTDILPTNGEMDMPLTPCKEDAQLVEFVSID
jgi:hypothetical protein